MPRSNYGLTIVSCIGLLLAGCTNSENSVGVNTSEASDMAVAHSTEKSSASASEEEPSPPGTEAQSDPSRTEDDPGQLTLAECAVGHWQMDNARMEAEYGRAMAGSGLSDAAATVSGELAVHFQADKSYVLTANASQTAIEGTADSDEVAFVLEHNGTESGGWDAGLDELTLDGQDQSGITTATDFAVNGAEMPSTHLPVPTTPWSGTLDAECDVERLVLVQHDSGETMTVEFIRTP